MGVILMETRYVLLFAVIFIAGCGVPDDTLCTGDACALPDADNMEDSDPATVVLVSFWGDGCPHCTSEKVFLTEMQEKYPDLEIVYYETWKDEDNQALFQEMATAYGVQARGVPTVFLGANAPIVGFSEQMKGDIESKIKSCVENGCPDPHERLVAE